LEYSQKLTPFVTICGNHFHGTLGSPGLFRLRCGEWRAIFGVERGTMIVKRVRHRRDVYR